jgi:predicted phage terminase large subunit-like protein
VRSRKSAKEFRRFAEEAGFDVGGTLDETEIRWGGGKGSLFKFSSIDGSLTGYTIDGVCVVDDFIKSRKEARSKAKREAGVDWWKSVARTRRHPGTSYIVMGTRWPGGDLTEHLITKEGFEYIRLAAIANPSNDNDIAPDGTVISDPLRRKEGESLWCRKPPDFFKEDRAHLFWWSSMYQGEPRPEGGRVFAEPSSFNEEGEPIGPGYYRGLPVSGYRVAFGVDLACTAKTRADWSICVEGWAVGDQIYIVDVQRKQVEAPSFTLTLLAKKTQRPGAPFRFYGSGTEKAAAQFIRAKIGSGFKFMNASADKLVRAIPASAAWNAGRILIPDTAHVAAPWLEDFLSVVCNFTGTPGEPDDDVDALAALHDQLRRAPRDLSVGGVRSARK